MKSAMWVFLIAWLPQMAQAQWVDAQEDGFEAAESPTGEAGPSEHRDRPESRPVAVLPTAVSLVGGAPTLIPSLPVARTGAEALAASRARETTADALLAAGKREEACEAYLEARVIGGDQNILLERTADCHQRAGRTASALATLYKLEERGRKFASERAEEMEPRVPRVRLMPPDGAEQTGLVLIFDGGVVPQRLWREPLMAEPGVHRIEARTSGRTPYRVEVKLPEADDIVEVIIAPLMLSLEAPVVEDPDEYSAAIVSGSITLGLTGAAVIAGILALDKRSAYHQANGDPAFANSKDVVLQTRDDARLLGNLSTGFAAGALIGAVATLYFWPSDPEETDDAKAEPSEATTLWWTPSPGGMAIGGAF